MSKFCRPFLVVAILAVASLATRAVAASNAPQKSNNKADQSQQVEQPTLDPIIALNRIPLPSLTALPAKSEATCSTQTCGDTSGCCPGLECIYPKNATVGSCKKKQ
jgi:hypothetical protein